MRNRCFNRKYGVPAAAVLGLSALLAACDLSKVSIPGLVGPSEAGLALKLTVTPDVLYADGNSTALVQAELRGPDGKIVAGGDIFFEITDGTGTFAAIGNLNTNRVATNSSGVAQVLYTAPARTDFTATAFVMIVARVVANDAGNAT